MQSYTPTPDFYNDYIAHHGILGMHWGKRNGPPYPLGSDKSTGHRLKTKGSVTKKKPKTPAGPNALTTKVSKNPDAKVEYINSKGDIINKEDLKALDKFQRWDDTDRYFENASDSVKKQVKEGRLSHNPEYGDIEFKVGKGNDELSIWGFEDQGVDAKTVKEISAKVLTSKKEITNLAIEMIKDEGIYQDWYKDMPWGGNLSEKEFYNKLALKNIYIPNPDYPNDVEISVYEKSENDDLLGGHSLDMEITLTDLKQKSRYGVSVNG